MANGSQIEDFYEVLGVPDFAELEVLREAYRKLALLLHPDKNQRPTATEEFQRLGRAWDTLRDPEKRVDYDRRFARLKRKRGRWDGEECRTGFCPRKKHRTANTNDERKRREEIRQFKKFALTDYLRRRDNWTRLRNNQVSRLIESRTNLQRAEHEMEENIQRDSTSDHGRNRILASLMIDAEKAHMESLRRQIANLRLHLECLEAELEERNLLYEEAELKAREHCVSQALLFAGPRDLEGRNDRAINAWNALSRVKSAVKFPGVWACKEPWHQTGEWTRGGGEYECQRCGESAYHIIPECGQATCPGCGMVVCHACHRDLHILREYEAWLTSPGDSQGVASSVFSLEFDRIQTSDEGFGSEKRTYGYGV